LGGHGLSLARSREGWKGFQRVPAWAF
jgi:hypothetical protein